MGLDMTQIKNYEYYVFSSRDSFSVNAQIDLVRGGINVGGTGRRRRVNLAEGSLRTQVDESADRGFRTLSGLHRSVSR